MARRCEQFDEKTKSKDLDNATSHRGAKEITNVKVKFLPTNLTSEVQPLDQGIIRAVKSRYRKQMLQYAVSVEEASDIKSDFNNLYFGILGWIYINKFYIYLSPPLNENKLTQLARHVSI
jgi:hypothetical protein